MTDVINSLGQITAVIGAQWGDEGKGKIVDILAESFDVIARANGGANAGHTIQVGDTKHIFHLLPSGCLHANKQIVLGSGTAIHLPTLIEEIKTLKAAGIDITESLFISHAAHVVLDIQREIDSELEKRRSGENSEALGTTRRGIGPTYASKAFRTGLRMGDVVSMSTEDLTSFVEITLNNAERMFGVEGIVENEVSKLVEARDAIGACVTDTVFVLHAAANSDKKILIEGAQATLLDIDHGTYPFVTSSATTSAGALQGLGLPPQYLDSCIGVCKAYCTRVGGGPFATERDDERGDALRERGGEYGATTGRPRRCGWLSVADLNYAASINGFTHLNLTKLDVLDAEETIPVSIGEEEDGTVLYEELAGWQTSTEGVTSFEELPENAQNYIGFIEEQVGVAVNFIGTGPGREEMVMRTNIDE